MSNNQKTCSNLLEDEIIQKELSKRFGLKAYWTFQEGINHFLIDKAYQNSFPLSVIINDFLFDIIKRDVEAQRLETINDIEEVKQILAHDPVAAYEKRKDTWTEQRIAKIQKRNLKQYGSKEKIFSVDEKEEEKRKFFCSKIKIKPETLICYIVDHIDLFSSEIEIPSKLQAMLQTVENLSVTENENVIKPTKEEVEELLMDVSPELERFYNTTKNVLDKKIKDTTAEEICVACREAYQKMTASKEPIDKIKYLEEADLDCSEISDNTEKLSQEIKGPILLKLVFRKYDNAGLKSIGIPTNYQNLHDLYRRLKKKTKK
ncbi:hypothetical protein [Desulfobacter sp.]|uniref:hypothetical protein n=1 Tax=Desulfobacter sp. TaxID=2294 RepID=UPI000E9A9696|nr:hypothetical protein [Desulfobacter sp.]HBT86905.1 hypothetical protein [Desulfobacter sp.]